MALQSRINEIFPNKKPFMDPAADGKRKAAGKDLRVQAMLGAQEAAKRQCVGDGLLLPQEQQPPAQDGFLQPQDSSNAGAPTDFSAFYKQLHADKHSNGVNPNPLNSNSSSRPPGSILQQSPQQNYPLPDSLLQQQQHAGGNDYNQQQQYCAQDDAGAFGACQGGFHQQQQQQQQQERQHSAAPTLDQLLNQHELGSRHRPPEMELKHMMSLDRAFGADASSRDGFAPTASGCNRSNSSATAAAAAAAAAASAAARRQHSWHLSDMPCIPWDWSTKSSARFASPAPFNVLEDDAQAGRAAGGQQGTDGGLECLCRAVAAAGGAAGEGAAGSMQERLQQALMQWQHPAAPLPPALLAAQSSALSAAAAAGGSAAPAAAAAGAAAAAAAADRTKVDPAAALLRERAQQWREALRWAYVALRHGHCPLVYVCGQAFKQPFTAVLCAPDINPTSGSGSSSSRFTAVVSRTNRLLRAHLATYGCEGVMAGQLEQQQGAAAAAAAAAAAGGRAGRQGQGKQQPQQPQLSAAAFDGQPGSQLLLVGVQHVHALYAALQALPWCEQGQPDVPLLFAPVPFLHAQLCPLRLVALPDALLDQQQQQRQAAAAAADAAVAPPQPLHYVELRAPGSIMPWTLHRLLGLLQDSQGLEGFQAFLGTEPCSSSLNVLPELWTAAAAAAAAGAGLVPPEQQQRQQQDQQRWRAQGRGLAASEVDSWGGSAVLLHGRAMRQLKLEEGNLCAKLA